jgi:hypothetical protein
MFKRIALDLVFLSCVVIPLIMMGTLGLRQLHQALRINTHWHDTAPLSVSWLIRYIPRLDRARLSTYSDFVVRELQLLHP